MTADLLRRAATELRATVNGAPDRTSDAAFKLAVADLLDERPCSCPPCTCCNSTWCDDRCECRLAAVAVARTYLGEPA